MVSLKSVLFASRRHNVVWRIWWGPKKIIEYNACCRRNAEGTTIILFIPRRLRPQYYGEFNNSEDGHVLKLLRNTLLELSIPESTLSISRIFRRQTRKWGSAPVPNSEKPTTKVYYQNERPNIYLCAPFWYLPPYRIMCAYMRAAPGSLVVTYLVSHRFGHFWRMGDLMEPYSNAFSFRTLSTIIRRLLCSFPELPDTERPFKCNSMSSTPTY